MKNYQRKESKIITIYIDGDGEMIVLNSDIDSIDLKFSEDNPPQSYLGDEVIEALGDNRIFELFEEKAAAMEAAKKAKELGA